MWFIESSLQSGAGRSQHPDRGDGRSTTFEEVDRRWLLGTTTTGDPRAAHHRNFIVGAAVALHIAAGAGF
jgi:hypothetical protein